MTIEEKAKAYDRVVAIATIKEKAKQAYLALEDDLWREGFVVGANYVLSAITECMPKTHSFNPNEVIDIIASRIKELKKK